MVFFLQVLMLEVTLKSNVSVDGRERIRVYTPGNGTSNLNTHHTETHRAESRPKLLGATIQTTPTRTFQHMPEFEGVGV